MADTTNHEYNVPDQGDQDWHSPFNENFEDFEVDIELRDQEANLGDYTPTEDAKFLATDTGVVYVGDGSSWTAAFVHPAYDAAADEAQFAQTVTAPAIATDSLGGQLTGGGNWTVANNLLEPSDNNIDGIDVDEVNASLLETGGGSVTVIVGGARTLELTAEGGNTSGNVLTGHSSNSLDSGVVGATISGGGYDDGNLVLPNTITGNYGSIGGGQNNEASGLGATVAGGRRNVASGDFSFAVGFESTADGDRSLAAGRNATTAGYGGAFVWGDSTQFEIDALQPNSVVFQAGGSRNGGPAVEMLSQSDPSQASGVELAAGDGSWSNLCSETVKTNIRGVDRLDDGNVSPAESD